MEHLEISSMAPNFQITLNSNLSKSKNLQKTLIFGLKMTTTTLASLQFNFPTHVMPRKKIM